MAGGMDLPPGSRVKAFRFSFKKDYRDAAWPDGPAEITFVYASFEGQGLRVLML